MTILFLLNGRADNLIEKHGLEPEQIDVVKIDEKHLIDRKKILGILKKKNYSKVIYGCINNDFQRFQIFMMIYWLLSGIKRGELIDSESKKRQFSRINTILFYLPRLCFEFFVSIGIALISHIKMFVLKRKYIGE